MRFNSGFKGLMYVSVLHVSWQSCEHFVHKYILACLTNVACDGLRHTTWKYSFINCNRGLREFIKKNPTRCNNVSKFYYSIFIWSLTCFGLHTAHHQEPKTALAASSFLYVEGFWTCSWWTSNRTKACQCSFRLLIMGGVSLETCWASYKYGIIKFWYIVASCWIFLYEMYYDARIHEHQVRGSVFLCWRGYGFSLLLGRHVVMRQLWVMLKVHLNFMVYFLVNCNLVITLGRYNLCVYRGSTARDANSCFPFQIRTL